MTHNFAARLAEVRPSINVTHRMKQEVRTEDALAAKNSLRLAGRLMHSGWMAIVGGGALFVSRSLTRRGGKD